MMKKVFLLLICSMCLCSCVVNEKAYSFYASFESDTSFENAAEAVYRKISAEEARKIMESTDDFILLDVRTDEEFKEKRIDGAILIPNNEIAGRAGLELPEKNAIILIYCRSGRRSAIAAKELVDMGYKRVYDFGGIIDWPYETTSD
jgi:rhodanese-related sulfurtransferase